jgi:hypothetical protein
MTVHWPEKKRCIVCLAFDIDAEISWRNIFRQNKIQRNNPVILSQAKYEPKVGVTRFENFKNIEIHEDITGRKPIGYRVPTADLGANN